jgi:hypothetical protein
MLIRTNKIFICLNSDWSMFSAYCLLLKPLSISFFKLLIASASAVTGM